MALDEKRADRSYQFGRLLAVMDRKEEYALYLSGKDGDRETNAVRMWSAYQKFPMRTYNELHAKTQYCDMRMKKSSREYYQCLQENIITMLDDIQGFNNHPLTEQYLVGYYAQKSAMRYTHSDSRVNDKEDEE